MDELDTPTAAPPPPPRPRPRTMRVVWATLAVGLVAAALSAAFVAWAVGSESGTRALLGLTPGLRVTDTKGALLGGEFSAARVEIGLGGRDRLVLEELRWQGLTVHADRSQAWNFGLHVQQLAAKALTVELPDPSRGPKTDPRTVSLPFAIAADQVELGLLRTPGLDDVPMTRLRGRVSLGEAGLQHVARDLHAEWGPLVLQGEGHLETHGKFIVDAKVDATRPGDDGAWTATAQTHGPVTALPLSLEIRARDQRLDLQATLMMFGATPLNDIAAKAQSFDLQALHPLAPRTALTGTVQARLPPLHAGNGDMQLQADVRNERPSSLDAGGLPVALLQARVTGAAALTKDGRRPFTLVEATVELADAKGPAGRVSARGSGAFTGTAAGRPALDARLEASATAVRTRGFDTRAPDLVFTGPVQFSVKDLPLGGESAGPGRLEARVDVKGQWLDGSRVSAAIAAPFELASTAQMALVREPASAVWRVQSIELPQFQVRADAGAASLNATLSSPDTGKDARRWQFKARGGLRDFDLRVLGIGTTSNRSAQQLNATMQADITGLAPSETPRGVAAWMRWISMLQGQLGLDVADSHVAGLPFSGKLTAQSASDGLLRVASSLQASDSRLQIEGRIVRSGQGAGDDWSAQAHSADLSTFSAVAQALGIDSPVLQGQLDAEARLSGRWPAVQTSGRLQGTAVSVGAPVHADALNAQWQVATQGDAPIDIDLTGTNLRWNAERLNALKFTIKGSARNHALVVRADRAARTPGSTATAATPPAWMQSLLAQADADGSLKTDGDGLQWSGRVHDLALIPVDANGVRGTPWLNAEPLGLTWRQDARQRSFAVDRTMLRLFNAELRLDRFSWSQADGRHPDLDLRAELVPLDVAPLMQRAQPDFGWSGDLRLGGHVSLQGDATGVRADIEVARLGGDLTITEDSGTQRLGLEALRLGITARNGTWQLSQILKGRNLGLLQGEQTLITAPHDFAPGANASLNGRLNLQIEQLGSLGAWLPVATVGAGWRLSGTLDSAVRLSGRLGAPLYTGELRGEHIGVRNGLEGVNLTDGTIDMVMSGEEARIREFSVKGGDGTATLRGGATFGESPHATLQLEADRFALLQRVDRRLILSGDGKVMLDADATRVSGALRVDEGLFDISRRDAPSIGDDVDVILPDDSNAAADKPARQAPKRKTLLDLRINAGDHLRLRGRGIDTLLKGELKLATNTANRLQVTGTILAENGTYTAYGQKLNLEKGRLEFRGAGDNPRLDIEAVRPPAPGSDDTAVRVGVAITGTAQEPRVRLFSEPEMSETDKLAWLVLGRSSDGLGRTDLIVLQRAAVALLSEEGDDPSQSVFGKLGIDELSVSQGDGQVKETIVKVGKQLSQRWYVGYERSLNATSGTWQVLYRIAQRYSIRAQAQQGGTSALDFIWTWRWD